MKVSPSNNVLTLPPYEAYRAAVANRGSDLPSERVKFSKNVPSPLSDDEYHEWLTQIYRSHFGGHITPPQDEEQRDEFDLCKLKFERRIARVAPRAETITKVAERYFAFAGIRTATTSKYRRNIRQFAAEIGDIPLSQVTPSALRSFRDKLSTQVLPASMHAVFTPITGLLGYAVGEGLIKSNPMSEVKLPRDKRAVEERKWPHSVKRRCVKS